MMTVTHTFEAQPDEWTLIGSLSSIKSFTTRAQKSVRAAYGDLEEPAEDADYTVVQNHLPRPVIEPYRQEQFVWIMPHLSEAMEVTAVLSSDHSPVVLLPAYGPLTSGVVGTAFAGTGLLSVEPAFRHSEDNPIRDVINLVIVDGALPPGLTLVPTDNFHSHDNVFDIRGTPTEAGEYLFTVAVVYKAGVVDAGLGEHREFARGIYSIEIAAS